MKEPAGSKQAQSNELNYVSINSQFFLASCRLEHKGISSLIWKDYFDVSSTCMQTGEMHPIILQKCHINESHTFIPTLGSSIIPDWIRSQLLGGL
jgi:hypothetical protein